MERIDRLKANYSYFSSRQTNRVLASDQESYELWRDQEGVPEDRIIRSGAKDNFWTMGEGAGPCGPCTEIFWDTLNDDLGEDRWLEIWNLVFMQNYRNEQGELENLPIVCVDTGMGLERLAAVVQNKENNFETDVFAPMFEGLHKIMTEAGIEVDIGQWNAQFFTLQFLGA